MLFYSYFKTLVGKQVTVELKNDLAITGTLHSVDQYLNIKLNNVHVVNEQKYPHMVRPFLDHHQPVVQATNQAFTHPITFFRHCTCNVSSASTTLPNSRLCNLEAKTCQDAGRDLQQDVFCRDLPTVNKAAEKVGLCSCRCL